VKTFLNDTFGSEKIISRGFLHEWPAQSPDLTPLDFWLWSFLKDDVYPNGYCPPNKEILKERIQHAAGAVTMQHLQMAVGNVKCRLEACLKKKGSHFEKCMQS
jgi:hypothetical protein